LATLHLIGLNDVLDAFYAGCFLGMSTPERLKGRIEPFLGAVLLSVVLIQVKRFLPGVGGSLGLAAFVTVWMLVTVKRITSRPALPNRNDTVHPTPSADATTEVVRSNSHGGVTPGFPSFAARPLRTIASAGLAALAVGCLLLPSEHTEVLDTTALAQVANEAAPGPEQSSLLQANLASETERPSEAPSVAAGNSDVTPDRLRAGQTVERNVQAAEEPANSSLPAISDVSAPRASGPAPGDVSGGVTESDAMLFREFRQWLASRPPGIAEARSQSFSRDRRRAQPAGVPTGAPAQAQRAHARRSVARQAVVQSSTRQPSA
jgi:hypothetical protein